MKLIQEINGQSDLKTADASDAGSTDVRHKGAEIGFDLMRNTINSDGKVKGSDVSNYLERAHDLNDEVETVLYGLETSDGKVVKVYVNATQADAFEVEMKKMLGMEDDIEEAINNLASKFDIVDVVWPKGEGPAAPADSEPEVNLDDAADVGDPSVEDEDEDMETIAAVDDETPVETEEEPEPEEEEGEEGEAEEEAEEEGEEEEEEAPASSDEAPPAEKKDKKDKKDDKRSLLKSIGSGLVGKKVSEGQVVKADFSKGKGVDAPDVEVPKGYDRFEVDGKKIIGIKDDKRKVVSTTSDERLAQELVRIYNGGRASQPIKKISLTQAFGSHDLAAAHGAGIRLTEKPSYWEEFEEGGHAEGRNLDDLKLKRLEHLVGKLREYKGADIYGTDSKPRSPLSTVKMMPAEDMFIVKFGDGSRYVADQTGAQTYIRMWQKIN